MYSQEYGDNDASFNRILQLLRTKLGWAEPAKAGDSTFISTVCPRCGKKKLSVNVRSGTYKCWKECGRGKLSDLLSGMSFDLVRGGGSKPEHDSGLPQRFISPGVVEAFTSLPQEHHAIQYILKRGFNPAYMEAVYNAGYCGEGEVFARGRYSTSDTLLFPMKMNGKMIAWQSRLLYDPDKLSQEECYEHGMVDDPEDGKLMRFPKYFTMPGYRKGTFFFGFDQARQSEVVVVTEGVFDVLGVGQCAVATLGKGVHDIQVAGLAANWKLAILLLDPDAQKENVELQQRLLQKGMRSVAVTLANDMDAGETPQELIWEQINEACIKQGIDLLTYKIVV